MLGFGTIVLILLLVTNAQTVFEEFIGSPVHDLAVLLILGRSILAIRSGVNIADVARRFKKFALAIGLLSAFGAIRLFGDTFGVAASQAGSFPEAWLKDMLIVVALVAGSVSLQRVTRLSWLMTGSIAILAGPALIQHLTGTYDFQWGGLATNETGFIDGEERVQIGGPLGSANPLAQWLLVALPFAMHFTVAGRRIEHRVAAGAMVLLAIGGIIATQSRQGMLVLLLLVGLWTVFYSRPSPKTLVRVAAVGVLVVGLVVAANPSRWVRQVERMGEVSALFGADIDPQSSAAGYAGTFWAGYDMFVDNPVGGVGHGNFAVNYIEYVDERGIDGSGKARSAHNLVIHLLAETGIVGTVTFVSGFALVVSLLRTARSRLRAYEFHADAELAAADAGLATALLLSLATWSAVSLFQGLFHTEQIVVVIGLALGFAWAADSTRLTEYLEPAVEVPPLASHV